MHQVKIIIFWLTLNFSPEVGITCAYLIAWNLTFILFFVSLISGVEN